MPAVAERLRQRLAERDAGVFHGVVIVDVQIALGADRHVDQRMARKLLEHVIEKADAGRNRSGSGSVNREADRNVGFVGLAGNRSGARALGGGHRASPGNVIGAQYQSATQISRSGCSPMLRWTSSRLGSDLHLPTTRLHRTDLIARRPIHAV
jgi:hypothetical protein